MTELAGTGPGAGGSRPWLAIVVIAVVIGVAAAAVIGVLRRRSAGRSAAGRQTRNEISGGSTHGPVIMAGAIHGSVAIGAQLPRGFQDTLVESTDRLAHAVRSQLRHEQGQRQIQDPFPLLVRWQLAPEELVDHWPSIRRDPTGIDVAPLPLAGRLDEIVDVYRRIPSGRLVVLGRAGSGKTVLAQRLALDLLEARATDSTDPVPVIFGLGAWNPATTTLSDWLAGQLVRDHPGLAPAGPGGPTLAAALVEARRILPILDGFDEIADGLHRAALKALNTTNLPLLLTSRRDEYAAAVAGTDVLTAAAGIELTDLTLTDVASYLPLTTRRRISSGADTPAEPAWDRVLRALRDPRSPAGANLAEVLRTPLMVSLVRTVYSDTPEHSPAALLDIDRFPTPETIEDHLLDNFIPTVYQYQPASRPGGRHRHWDPGRARLWLGYLAWHLDRLGTADLAWWQLGNTLPRPFRMLLVGLVCGSIFGLVNGFVTGLKEGLALGFVPGVKVGLMAGLVFGIVSMFMFGLLHGFGVRVGRVGAALEPSRVHIQVSGGTEKNRARFLPRFGSGFAMGFVFGNAAWLVVIGAVWFLVQFLPGLVSGPVSELVRPLVSGLNGLRYGLQYGFVYGLMAGLVFGLIARFEASVDIRTVATPIGLLRLNRTTILFQFLVWGVVGVLVGVLGGGLWFQFMDGLVAPDGVSDRRVGYGIADGLVLGLVGVFGGGLGYGLSLTAWGQWLIVARIWLPLTGRLPWAVTAFLEDANRRGVLRQAGAVYRFRHAQLQAHLIRTHPQQPPE